MLVVFIVIQNDSEFWKDVSENKIVLDMLIDAAGNNARSWATFPTLTQLFLNSDEPSDKILFKPWTHMALNPNQQQQHQQQQL